MKRIDLVGQRFGSLVAVKMAPSRKFGTNTVGMWECLCDCGKTSVVNTGNLRGGISRSCGCSNGPSKVTHGYTINENGDEHPIYRAWYTMKARCSNPKVERYPRYGGRGIKVCEKWQLFEGFLEDMGATWQKGLTIDRFPDHDGNYCPENCRWATQREQQNNKASNVLMTFGGETRTMMEWSRITGMKYDKIKYRRRRGWDDARILSTPVVANQT